jgi:hypothetical protein
VTSVEQLDPGYHWDITSLTDLDFLYSVILNTPLRCPFGTFWVALVEVDGRLRGRIGLAMISAHTAARAQLRSLS